MDQLSDLEKISKKFRSMSTQATQKGDLVAAKIYTDIANQADKQISDLRTNLQTRQDQAKN